MVWKRKFLSVGRRAGWGGSLVKELTRVDKRDLLRFKDQRQGSLGFRSHAIKLFC